jgi:hypothetical protein
MALAPQTTKKNIRKPAFSGWMNPAPLEETPNLKKTQNKRPYLQPKPNNSFPEAK